MYLTKDNEDERNMPITNLMIILIIGIMIIISAASIFGIFMRPQSDWRIYNTGSIGATIIVISSVYFLAYFILGRLNSQIIFIGIISILAGLGFNQSINQYDYYWNIAQNKARFLDFTQNIESASPEATWVFLTDIPAEDLVNRLDHFLIRRIRNASLQVTLQEKSLDSIICFPNSPNCKFHTKKLRIPVSPYLPDKLIPYEQIVFFWLESDLSVRLLETLPDELSYAKDFYQPFEHIRRKEG